MPAATRRATRIVALSLGAALALPVAASSAEITVFAAASLRTALDEIAARWQANTGNTAVIAYGGSPMLARQIEEGAPADIFISASKGWMDSLADDGLLRPGTRRDLLGNTLVLVAAGHDAAPVAIAPGFDLASLLGDGKLSMALVDAVPAGQYGREALESLGVWSLVAASVAQSENVRVALALVAAGEAPFGIVYASDAVAADGVGDAVTVVGTFPADSHQPIVYPAAVLAASAEPAALAFLDALSSDAASTVFEGQGFIVLR